MTEQVEQKQVSPEQLEKLVELNSQWNFLTKRFGELHSQKKLLLNEIEAVDAAFDEVEERRQVLVNELTEQFGTTGTVNLQDGTFTPDA